MYFILSIKGNGKGKENIISKNAAKSLATLPAIGQEKI